MMKKLLTALLIALAVVLIMAAVTVFFPRGTAGEESSAADSLAPTEMLVVPSDMPEGIFMSVPQGFTETSSQYYTKYYVKDDASVIITGEDMSLRYAEIDNYTESVIDQYKESVDEFQLIEDEVVTVSNTRAHLLEFSYAIIGDNARQDFKCTTAVMIYRNNAYLVTCKSHADTYQNYREVFRMALSTIRLSDPAEGTALPIEESIPETEESVPETAVQTEAEPEDSVQP
ncbi:MAG: hypothetical protein IKH27_01675 [Oscillospiraceae bacterium]|nr:hypothetical protein [Oscillospiraceae bacterium]